MARMIGEPSKYLRNTRFLHIYDGLLLIVVMFWFYLIYLLLTKYFNFQVIPSAILSVIIIVIFKLIDQKEWQLISLAGKYRQGLEGEALIRKALTNLPDSYTVIQDVMIPGTKSNIDFVVVGVNGIFAIEVKSHKGVITYDGKRLLRDGFRLKSNFLWQTRTESSSLTEYLQANVDRSLYAIPILVFSSSDATMKFGRAPVDGVVIIKIDWLIEHITKNIVPVKISKESIDQVVNFLCTAKSHGGLSGEGVK